MEAAREVFPNNFDIYVQLGYTYFALGNLDEAEVALQSKVTAAIAITDTFIQSHCSNLNDQKIGATLWHTFNSHFYSYTHGMFSPTKELFPNYTFATDGNLTIESFISYTIMVFSYNIFTIAIAMEGSVLRGLNKIKYLYYS